MKHKLSTTLGLIVLLTIALAASRANAQTVANGPYYANPSWDQTLACTTLATCPRFIVLSNMASAAVLDRETGLVWERSPSISTLTWSNARTECTVRTTGGRKGWRLPSVHELASLVDPTHSEPALPPGHPFSDVQSSLYWSATTNADDAVGAWGVSFNNGSVGSDGKSDSSVFVWCVRGGMNADQY